jgi:hypothetical protein
LDKGLAPSKLLNMPGTLELSRSAAGSGCVVSSPHYEASGATKKHASWSLR